MKLWMGLLTLAMALTTKATIIAFDDFSGGVAGTSIYGSTDDYGHTWTRANQLNGALYGAGDFTISPTNANGGALIGGNFSQSAVSNNIIKLSVDLTPYGHTALNNAQLTIGFFNTINKGILANLDNTSTNFVSFKMIFQNTSGNEGKGVWNVRASGSSNTTSWFGDGQELGTNTYKMVLSYDFTTGDVTADVLDTDNGNIVVLSATTTTATGLSFAYAGFGWSSLDTGWTTANPSGVTNFTVEAIPEPATSSMVIISSLTVFMMRRMIRS